MAARPSPHFEHSTRWPDLASFSGTIKGELQLGQLTKTCPGGGSATGGLAFEGVKEGMEADSGISSPSAVLFGTGTETGGGI